MSKHLFRLTFTLLIATLSQIIVPINSWALTNLASCSISGNFQVINGEARNGGLSSGNCKGDPNFASYNLGHPENTITKIGVSAFQGTDIPIVEIPIEVTEIKDYAFSSTDYLISVSILNPGTIFGAHIFENARNLSDVNLPDGLTRIGVAMFGYTTSLITIDLPSSVTTIDDLAFMQSGLASITFPNSLQTIGNAAFYETALSTILIPNNVTSISDYAFSYTTHLASATLSSGLTSISAGLFYHSAISSISIPNCVTSIGDSAFEGASQLADIDVGSSLTYIGKNAFDSTTSLNQIILPDSLITIDNEAFLASSISQINLPSQLQSIGVRTFVGTQISQLVLPQNLNSIGIQAFFGLSISSYNIPASVTSFGSGIEVFESYPNFNKLVTIRLESINSYSLFYLACDSSPNFCDNNGQSTQFRLSSGSLPAGIILNENSGEISGSPIESGTFHPVFEITLGNGNKVSVSNFTFIAGDGVNVVSPQQQANSVPIEPTSVLAIKVGKHGAKVTFNAPVSNGGSSIFRYEAVSNPGNISQTLMQSTGGTFTFDGLQPETSYTFSVTAVNSVGYSNPGVSNLIKTDSLVEASLSSLKFEDDGTGTGGKLIWVGKNIDAVLYTGQPASYPGPYNYGAFTSSWNGRIRNLSADTSYTVSILAISADGVGESKTLTFKTSPNTSSTQISSMPSSNLPELSQLDKLFEWIDQNLFTDGEASRVKRMLSKFDALPTLSSKAYLKLPTSRVTQISAKSETPAFCNVGNSLTVQALMRGKCVITYTVTGESKAPASLTKEFNFPKV